VRATARNFEHTHPRDPPSILIRPLTFLSPDLSIELLLSLSTDLKETCSSAVLALAFCCARAPTMFWELPMVFGELSVRPMSSRFYPGPPRAP
jgi:hypothetical protein